MIFEVHIRFGLCRNRYESIQFTPEPPLCVSRWWRCTCSEIIAFWGEPKVAGVKPPWAF